MNIAFAVAGEQLFYAGVCVMVFLFGITIGSFLNVCILRLPAGESLTKRNSHCMTCGTEIKRYDLIPLFSWLILGGKCRACKAPISPRYSVVEGLTGVLFVLMYLRYDFIADGLIYPALLCLFLAGVIVIGFEDFDTQEMSVCVLVYLGVLAFATRVLSVLFPTALRGNSLSITDGLVGMFSVSVPLLVIGFVITPLFYILFISEDHKTVRKLKKRLKKEKLSDKEREKLTKVLDETLLSIKENGPVFGFGMGDVIFMAAGGLMLGWKAAVVALFIAIVIGAAAALVIKLKSSKKEDESSSAFAFGPCLAIGLGVAAYYGTEIFDWYISAVTTVPVI
ncbi:MAG: prepilin peptidase [Oscillospiraceae bacterium]|nr:prepilin peptidase [Oscillospiraceae bacterium]